ncbi:glycosyl transferase, partial [Streptomyces sp. BF-3]
ALILLVAGLWLTRKAGRTDSARAAFIAWGGALVMTAAVFSFMAGIFHQYYTVALAPYVSALVAMGVVVLWEERSAWWPRAVLAGTVLATVLWAYVLLGRTPDYLPWLRWAVLAGGIVGALGLLVVGRFGGRGLAVAVVGLSCAASLAGPAAYT